MLENTNQNVDDRLSKSSESGYKDELKRKFDLKGLVIFGLVTISPIGPMLIYGQITPTSNGLVSLAYVFGLIAMLFPGLSYIRMCREYPIAGGIYSFVQRGTNNAYLGFIMGWIILLDYVLVPACLCAYGGAWLNSTIPAIPSYVWVWAFLAIVLLTNSRGITVTEKMNVILFIAQMIVMVVFIILAIVFVSKGGGTGHFNLDPFFSKENFNFQSVSAATAVAIFSFLGFDALSTMSEDTLNPKRTVSRAIFLVLIILSFMFVFQGYFAAQAHPDFTTLDPDIAWLQIAEEIGGPTHYYAWLVVGILAFSLALVINMESAASRVIFAMARDKMLPASGFLGKINVKTKIPFNAMIVIAVINGIWAVLPASLLTHMINFGALFSFMMINVTVFWHYYIRKKMRGAKGFFSYVVLPAVGFAVIFWLWINLVWQAMLIGGIWIAIGLIVCGVKTKGFKDAPLIMKELE